MTYPHGQQPYGQPQQPGYGPPSGGMPAPYGAPPPGGMPPGGMPPSGPMQAPYGQPQPGFGGPGMPPGQPGGHDIPDYKGWAIGCIFLFWILAIFAIMKSNEVQTYKMQGNFAMAKQASDSTRTMCLIATIIGAAGWVIGIIVGIILVSTAPSYVYY
ncbi:interferon-induced transmembrane protein [Tamaricihabitans halophyticus]|uniref:Interferon-induced transmembrane protein n=1 Tax=Tamaricihabitans halophyticus TaxID=1262583 RepID=A0A4R2QVT4_9PSEU|nr:CD225/dispanin family protein [Tamaricihabitans halophyticus]TCP54183.1 interferon-induced transmembrane protein [Tamaricihabitans halophyticus]